jgi:ribosomal protein S15P/S13E
LKWIEPGPGEGARLAMGCGREEQMKLSKLLLLGMGLIATAGYLRHGPDEKHNPTQTTTRTGIGAEIRQSTQIADRATAVSTDSELAALSSKIEEIDNHLRDSGLMAGARANRLTPFEQKQVAAMIEQMNDLRSREIDIRLAAVRAQLNSRAQ